MSAHNLNLGIDIGTTKVAAVVIDAGGAVLAAGARAHGADVPAGAGHAEQDPGQLLAVAREVVRALPSELRARVGAVGATGQMHGVVAVNAQGDAVTPLVTWQDARGAAEGFLTPLRGTTGYSLYSGFGCVTLAWWVQHGALPATATGSGTIQDYLVAQLTGSLHPVIDPTDAASWGLFDLHTLAWDRVAIGKAGIPEGLLPEVLPSGTPAGVVTAAAATAFGIPAGIPVAVAVGDNQASLLATLTDPATELALTLGTGGQVSAVLPAGTAVATLDLPAACEVRPFPGGRYALVGASLCGGAGWAWLAQLLEGWFRELGVEPPAREEIYAQLNARGQAATAEITVYPHFLGERHAPDVRGALTGLTLDNATLGAVARGLARGILTNLRDMLPADALRGRTRLVGSGNALRKNPLLQQLAQEVFGLPLTLADGVEEAAVGAALLAQNAGARTCR